MCLLLCCPISSFEAGLGQQGASARVAHEGDTWADEDDDADWSSLKVRRTLSGDREAIEFSEPPILAC